MSGRNALEADRLAEWFSEVEKLLSELHDHLIVTGQPSWAGRCVNLLGRMDALRDEGAIKQ